ncbi:MAG: thiaminase II [Alphaproteobacteria bacterium]|nr:thiaminase II [Alphaproteobacteria bacterium]
MKYGSSFAQFRAGAGNVWQEYVSHRFVTGMGDGTLPRAAFLYYLKQDYVFLIHFSRAWALAVAKADTVDEMRACTATLNALINEELKLHIELCGREGIDEATLFATQEAPQNLVYTRYVLDAGYSGDFLDMLAALAPCVLGYGEIGASLGASSTSDIYREWINAYSSSEYQDVCGEFGVLMDNAIHSRLGTTAEHSARMPALQKRFTMATSLEVGFWQMGIEGA